jgi:hypothetical protein
MALRYQARGAIANNGPLLEDGNPARPMMAGLFFGSDGLSRWS